MAENGLDEPVIGVILDGAGLGTDGAIWGGEFLVGGYRNFTRAAHLRYVAMPGGEQATLEPWRMAASYLLDAGLGLNLLESIATPAAQRHVQRMVNQKCHAPLTSSMGRLFDAIAALARIRAKISYEGQAASELEWLATEMPSSAGYSWEVCEMTDSCQSPRETDVGPWWIVDTRPIIRDVSIDVMQGVSAALIARRFHSTVVDVISDICRRIQRAHGMRKIVCSGGVFMNALLRKETDERLGAEGFSVFHQRRVPANDGGLSLGQLAIASRSAAPAAPN
jgi:hydrogenase maturation protein HypF